MNATAGQYDQKEFTITRHVVIEDGVRPHSSPVLAMNSRFLDNDGLALETHIHEQVHWLTMERHRQDLSAIREDRATSAARVYTWP